MDTTWTVASCVLMSSPLLELLFFPMQEFTTLLVHHPRRVFLPRLKARFVIICLILPSHDRHRVAHLSLNRIPGAGAWLFALPDPLESHIPAPPFRVSLRRLRFPIWTQDSNCTLCGQVMDQWSDHALVCGCGGDRVTRHNLILDVVHSAANNKACLGPVLEKPRLLLPHDPSLDDRPSGPDPPGSLFSLSSPRRRLCPSGPSGGQEAWDFSITSGLRLRPAVPDPAAFPTVFSSVESRKRAFLDTASQCAQVGISFLTLGHRGRRRRLVGFPPISRRLDRQ